MNSSLEARLMLEIAELRVLVARIDERVNNHLDWTRSKYLAASALFAFVSVVTSIATVWHHW